MVKISFKTKVAQHIYEDYMLRISKNISVLSETDRNEMIMEFNSHIYEGTIRSNKEDEAEILLNVIGKLGVPEEFLKPLVAQKKLNQAITTFNPGAVFQAIKLNLKNGVIYSVFGLLYLFLFTFLILIFAKILAPSNTGLFYENTNFKGFGYLHSTTGYTELLGYWFIPITIFTALFLYVCITLLLRITRRQ
jgi:uncharacterized membrane protein